MTRIGFLAVAGAALLVVVLSPLTSDAQPLSASYASRLHKMGMPFRTINNYFLNRYSKRAASPPGFFHGFGKRTGTDGGQSTVDGDNGSEGGNDATAISAALQDGDGSRDAAAAMTLEARTSIELLRALISARDELLNAILSQKKPATSAGIPASDYRYDMSEAP